MAITYFKKANKTPQSNTDETRAIVSDMLAKIEAGGEEAALTYGRNLDGYTGDAIVSEEIITKAADAVSDQVKDDIKFALERVTKFAEAQKASIQEFETELSPGFWASQKLIPIETAGCYVPGGRYAAQVEQLRNIYKRREERYITLQDLQTVGLSIHYVFLMHLLDDYYEC